MFNFQGSEKEFNTAGQALQKADGVIAFPTDTVWGIGCLVENESAVKRIYSIKGRSGNKPLILLGSKIEHLVPYVSEVPDIAQEIISRYLPGAVTLILPKSNKTPSYMVSGGNTVGIRIPDCQPFIELLENYTETHVLATTSANISGQPPALTKKEAENILGNKVDYILDDFGYESKGTASTVVAVDSEGNIKILRQGSVIINL